MGISECRCPPALGDYSSFWRAVFLPSISSKTLAVRVQQRLLRNGLILQDEELLANLILPIAFNKRQTVRLLKNI